MKNFSSGFFIYHHLIPNKDNCFDIANEIILGDNNLNFIKKKVADEKKSHIGNHNININ